MTLTIFSFLPRCHETVRKANRGAGASYSVTELNEAADSSSRIRYGMTQKEASVTFGGTGS